MTAALNGKLYGVTAVGEKMSRALFIGRPTDKHLYRCFDLIIQTGGSPHIECCGQTMVNYMELLRWEEHMRPGLYSVLTPGNNYEVLYNFDSSYLSLHRFMVFSTGNLMRLRMEKYMELSDLATCTGKRWH